MIYDHQYTRNRQVGGFFHLQDEKTKTRVSGFGQGDHIRLKDEYGNAWFGSAERNQDGSIVFRFRAENGKSLIGISQGEIVTLRDERGGTWKGFVA